MTICSTRMRSQRPTIGSGIETSMREPVSAACSRSRPATSPTRSASSNGLEVQRQPSRRQARHVEQIVDEADEPVGGRSRGGQGAPQLLFGRRVARRGAPVGPGRRRQPQLERGERRLELVRRDRDEFVADTDRRAPLGQRRDQRQHADRRDRHVAIGHQQAFVGRARREIAARRRRRRHGDHRDQQQRRRDPALLEAQRRPDQQRHDGVGPANQFDGADAGQPAKHHHADERQRHRQQQRPPASAAAAATGESAAPTRRSAARSAGRPSRRPTTTPPRTPGSSRRDAGSPARRRRRQTWR